MSKAKFTLPENLPYYKQVRDLSARQIIDYVKARTGKSILIDPKNKLGIIKRSIVLLKEANITTSLTSRDYPGLHQVSLINNSDKLLIKNKTELSSENSELTKAAGRIMEILSVPVHISENSHIIGTVSGKRYRITPRDIAVIIKVEESVEDFFSEEELKSAEKIKDTSPTVNLNKMSKGEMIKEAKSMFHTNIGGILGGLFTSESEIRKRLTKLYIQKGYMVIH